MAITTSRYKLAKFVCIVDGFARNFHQHKMDEIIKATKRGTIPWIILRDYKVPSAEYREAAVMMVRSIRKINRAAEISINRRIDLAFEMTTGLHMGNDFAAVMQARKKMGKTARIGVSLHADEYVDERIFKFIDYCFFSPVYQPTSKPNVRPVGEAGLSRFCQQFPEEKVYALGGITPENAVKCLEAGATGIAVSGGVIRAPNVSRAARSYNTAIKYATANIRRNSTSTHDGE